MEIESKYALTAPIAPEAMAALDLGGYQLTHSGRRQQHDVLLDTADRAISGSKHALRIRDLGVERVLTFKGPARVVDGIHEREELEATLPAGDGLKRARWPREIADRVRALAGDEKLLPLLEISVWRETWLVERDGVALAELALDQGRVMAAGAELPIAELELELKHGERALLEELGERLRAQLPLQPEPRSKLQRGLALLAEHEPLSGKTPLVVVGRKALGRFVKKLHEAEPTAREGSDPEGVHDMRVATRRLRTTMQILEESPAFDPERRRKLRRRLRRLAAVLGAVRDSDVMIEHVQAFGRANPEWGEDLAELGLALERRRARARAQLIEELDTPRNALLLKKLSALLAPGGELSTGAAEQRQLVRHFAGSAIWRRYEALLSYELLLAEAPAETLHQLRIAGKRLRYALDLFGEALGPESDSLLKQLANFQDHLGTMQDAATAQALMRELLPGERSAGLQAYDQHCRLEQERLRGSLPERWAQVSGLAFRKRLAAMIARL